MKMRPCEDLMADELARRVEARGIDIRRVGVDAHSCVDCGAFTYATTTEKEHPMSMTKQDFQLIADVIRDTPTTGGQRWNLANKFGDVLRATNPRFDRDRFVQAANGGVTVPTDDDTSASDFVAAEPSDTGLRWSVMVYAMDGHPFELLRGISQQQALDVAGRVRSALRTYDGWTI